MPRRKRLWSARLPLREIRCCCASSRHEVIAGANAQAMMVSVHSGRVRSEPQRHDEKIFDVVCLLELISARIFSDRSPCGRCLLR